MRRTRVRIAVIFFALLASGCRLPGHDGSTPNALLSCRRLSQQGVAALERGEQQTAESLLTKAVAACPVDAEARRHYAESLWRRGARSEAVAQMEEAGRLAGEDASLWTRLAEMHLSQGHTEQAWQSVERALEIDPKLPEVWLIRGGILRTAGRHREALVDQLRALRYAPRDRRILLDVAELYRELNEPERALQTLQTLSETYSPGEEPGRVLFLQGLAYVALGRYDDGAASLAAAVTRENPTPEMYYRWGAAELLAGNPAKAAAAARQALAMQPEHAACRELLQRIELAERPHGAPRR